MMLNSDSWFCKHCSYRMRRYMLHAPSAGRASVALPMGITQYVFVGWNILQLARASSVTKSMTSVMA